MIKDNIVHSMSNRLGFSMAFYHSSNQLIQLPNTSAFIGSPLSLLTSREIVLFCHYKHIPYAVTPSILSCKGESVYRLALEMVESLQDECDSTLHIVTETCGKLQQCPSVFGEKAKQCRLCKDYTLGRSVM